MKCATGSTINSHLTAYKVDYHVILSSILTTHRTTTFCLKTASILVQGPVKNEVSFLSKELRKAHLTLLVLGLYQELRLANHNFETA